MTWNKFQAIAIQGAIHDFNKAKLEPMLKKKT